MNKKDLDRTKETIRLQLGMDLSRMVHSKKFSIDELLDYCAYISAFNTLYKSEEVDTIEKHEIIRQIFYIYNQVFNAPHLLLTKLQNKSKILSAFTSKAKRG